MMPDHYQALGVLPGASRDEIRAAYLRAMRQHHPDRRPHDPMAAERARAANAAWRVLRDGSQRSAYDRRLAAPHGTARVGRGLSAASARRRAAYSAEQAAFRRRFHQACLRIGFVVLAVGFMALAAVS